jgi:hypothetical protein
MAWRLVSHRVLCNVKYLHDFVDAVLQQNALKMSAMGQFALNWGILTAALIIALPTFLSITDTTYAEEWEEDIDDSNSYEERQHHQDIKP